MSAYTDRVDAARNTDSPLFRQVIAALWKAAQDITNESAGTAQHTQRLAWATRVRFGGYDSAAVVGEAGSSASPGERHDWRGTGYVKRQRRPIRGKCACQFLD
jgi:hypothetical protein